jgi:prophage antirepressor-like protein
MQEKIGGFCMNEQNKLSVFSYGDELVRTMTIDDEPWFVLRDVCGILELGSPHKVVDRLDEDERNQIPLTDALGRQQMTTIINESGLYSVILRSDKPQAKPFRKWVTSEVLPALRKTGEYHLEPRQEQFPGKRSLTTDDYLRAASIVANCRNERLPYVLGFLEQGGFSIPKVRDTRAEIVAQLSDVLNDAIVNHGMTVRQIGKMVGLDGGTISAYRRGKHHPKGDRAEYIIRVVQSETRRKAGTQEDESAEREDG